MNEYALYLRIDSLEIDAFLHCNDLTYGNDPESELKTFVLKDYVGYDTVDVNIRDPFGMNKKDYEECADEVENAIKKLVDKLSENNMS